MNIAIICEDYIISRYFWIRCNSSLSLKTHFIYSLQSKYRLHQITLESIDLISLHNVDLTHDCYKVIQVRQSWCNESEHCAILTRSIAMISMTSRNNSISSVAIRYSKHLRSRSSSKTCLNLQFVSPVPLSKTR